MVVPSRSSLIEIRRDGIGGGELSAQRSRPVIGTLIAATAIRHDMTLVARNVQDVQDTGVRLLNPWK